MKKYFSFFISFFISFFLFEQKINCKFNFKDKFNKISNFSTKNKVILGLSTAALLGISLYKGYKYLNLSDDFHDILHKQIIKTDTEKAEETEELIQNWLNFPNLKGKHLKGYLNKYKDYLVIGFTLEFIKFNENDEFQESMFFVKRVNLNNIEDIDKNSIIFTRDKKFTPKVQRIVANSPTMVEYREVLNNNKSFIFTNIPNYNFIKSFYEINQFNKCIIYESNLQINDRGLMITFDKDNYIIIDVSYKTKQLIFYKKLTNEIINKYPKTLEKINKIKIPQNLLDLIPDYQEIQYSDLLKNDS